MVDVNRWDVKDAVLASDLSPAARLVMLVLVLRADAATGRIPQHRHPTVDELAGETGLANSTVRTVLTALVDDHWIARDRPSRRAPSVYQLVPVSAPTRGALSPPDTGALSEPTIGALIDASAPTRGGLSAPTPGASAPTAGAESADSRRTISSRSSESREGSSGAAPADAPAPLRIRPHDLDPPEPWKLIHCSRCDVPPGRFCVNEHGQVTSVHDERRRAGERAAS